MTHNEVCYQYSVHVRAQLLQLHGWSTQPTIAHAAKLSMTMACSCQSHLALELAGVPAHQLHHVLFTVKAQRLPNEHTSTNDTPTKGTND